MTQTVKSNNMKHWSRAKNYSNYRTLIIDINGDKR